MHDFLSSSSELPPHEQRAAASSTTNALVDEALLGMWPLGRDRTAQRMRRGPQFARRAADARRWLTEPTIEKLRALKLFTMTTAWIAQRQDPSIAERSFDERLALLVEVLGAVLAEEHDEWAVIRRYLTIGPPDALVQKHTTEGPETLAMTA